MQIIYTSLQTDNHASTTSLQFFTGRMLFLTPNQQCQSIEGRLEVKRNAPTNDSSMVCTANTACELTINAVIIYSGVRSTWEISTTPALPLTDCHFVLHTLICCCRQLSIILSFHGLPQLQCSSFYACSHRYLLVRV